MRGEGTEAGLRETLETGRRELALYLGAAAVYIAIGVAFPELLFAWVVALGYLLLCVVVLPMLARRLRRS